MVEFNTGGKWERSGTFKAEKLDEAGAGNYFETSQSKITLPTLTLDCYPPDLRQGIVSRIHYRLKPTNAVTFTLRLWDIAVDGATKPYEENLAMIYESPALQASDVDYDREVTIPFRLASKGTLYYSIEWSGASGNTQGFISIQGEIKA